jgi:subfamily B ATP-binding cassette protein MsbA
VNSYLRLVPFLWPSRHKLYLSFVFAGLVAALWGANLSVAFPLVKVLLQGQSLKQYVQQEIANASKEVDDSQHGIDADRRQLELADDHQQMHIAAHMAKEEIKRNSATQRLATLQWVNYRIIPFIPDDGFRTFALILAALLVLTALKLICMFAEDILVGSVVQLAIMRIRKQLFRRVLTLDYQTLMLRGASDLMARFTYDIETLANGLSLLGGKVIREPLKAVACLGLAFWFNWRLTLLSLLFVPLAGAAFHRIGRLLKKASQKSMESMSRIYKVLEETFNALKVVIAFNGARRHRQHHHRENKVFYKKSMSITTIDSLTSPITEMLGMSAVVMALLPGAYLVMRGTTSIWGIKLTTAKMDVAELSVLYAILTGVLDPVRKLSSVFGKLKKSGAAADRIFQLMDIESLVKDPEVPRKLRRKIETIEFQNVGFTYAANGHTRPPVLTEVSLKLKVGEVFAVVGENGCGKSTLVNLLPRYFDPDLGSVLLDGVDLRECSLHDLRTRIGVVTQETLLFDDTIFENIRYGRTNALPSEVEEAAQRAYVTQFLDQLPQGFQTRIGEKGTALSGGQRQRIALARAILRNPEILILDEATSAIDSQSECLIHKALQEFLPGRTAFIITHSVTQSVLELVTRIIVLDRGQIAAVGTHDELLASCSIYRRLYQVQSSQAVTPSLEEPLNQTRRNVA